MFFFGGGATKGTLVHSKTLLILQLHMPRLPLSLVGVNLTEEPRISQTAFILHLYRIFTGRCIHINKNKKLYRDTSHETNTNYHKKQT